LLGLAFLLYLNTLSHDYVIDDRIVVTNNSLTQQGISAIPSIFNHSYLFGYDGREDESYRPLTLTTFAVERSFFDANPSASHFVQILLYALCIFVLFRFLQQLFSDKNSLLPFIITLLFLVHPIHTEVVANIKSRDEILSALFLFASWNQFLIGMDKSSKKAYFLALLLFFFACLSKDSAVAGIAIFPLLLYFFRNEKLLLTLKKSSLFIIPLTIYFLIRSSVLSDVLIHNPIHPVANALAVASSSSELVATNLSIFTKYIQLFIAPIQLSWDYSIAQIPLKNWADFSTIIGLLILISLFVLSIWGTIKRSIFGFGAIFFLATFALTSNFIFLINCTLGERFLFLPILGLIICVVFLFKKIVEKHKKYTPIFLVLLLILGASKTVSRNMDWKNNLTIYRAGIEVCPNSVKTHFNLGTEYITQGHETNISSKQIEWYELSKKELLRCIKIYPNYELIYQNIGFVYGELGRLESDSAKALSIYKEGVQLIDNAIEKYHFKSDETKQNSTFLKQRALVYSQNKEEQKALIHDLNQRVSSKKVKTLENYKEAAYYHEKLGQLDSVLVDYRAVLKNFPKEKQFIKEISRVLFMQEKYTESLTTLNDYLIFYPEDWSAQTNKAMLLEITEKKNDALQLYEFILSKDPTQIHAQQLYEQLKQKMRP
jgi:hypothetical protein